MKRISFFTLVFVLGLFALCCKKSDATSDGAEPVKKMEAPSKTESTEKREPSAEKKPRAPYTAKAVIPDNDGTTRVLIYTDMEGISGVNRFEQVLFGKPEYQTGFDNLTKDVNAVVEGLVAGGADVIHVTDAHGSGNPNPDLDLEKLDPRAQILFKDKPYRSYIELAETEQYDAIVAVAMHAKTGEKGFLSHTYNGGCDWIMNGKSISETEIVAHSWGRNGIPVIFVSGDDVLKEQLAYMDWMEYVTVKKSISWSDAELFDVDKVREEMRKKARIAMENMANAKYLVFSEPITAGLRTRFPADHSILEGVPGIDYKDDTVMFNAPNFRKAYDGIVELIQVTQWGRANQYRGFLKQTDHGKKLSKEFQAYRYKKMIEFDAGEFDPKAKSEKKEEKGKKWFGSR